jgi:hypothetical protein
MLVISAILFQELTKYNSTNHVVGSPGDQLSYQRYSFGTGWNIIMPMIFFLILMNYHEKARLVRQSNVKPLRSESIRENRGKLGQQAAIDCISVLREEPQTEGKVNMRIKWASARRGHWLYSDNVLREIVTGKLSDVYLFNGRCKSSDLENKVYTQSYNKRQRIESIAGNGHKKELEKCFWLWTRHIEKRSFRPIVDRYGDREIGHHAFSILGSEVFATKSTYVASGYMYVWFALRRTLEH